MDIGIVFRNIDGLVHMKKKEKEKEGGGGERKRRRKKTHNR